MRGFRTVGVVAAALVSAVVLTLGGTPVAANACGCGGLLPLPETTVSSSNEKALIWWDGETQTIELTFDVTSDAATAGLLIPTPGPAELSAGDLRTFALAEATIHPTVTIQDDWWGLDHVTPDPERIERDVIETVDLAAFQPQTIPASDTAAVAAWLAAGGYVVSEDLQGALNTYANYGWSFTAIRLDAQAAIDGHIPPVRLTFKTSNLVYPMRLARYEAAPQQVRLYVFDEHRNDVVQSGSPTLGIDGRTDLLYSGEVQDTRLRAMGPYLTAYDVVYDDPENDITSDIGFYESLNDNDYLPRATEYRTISLLGVPVGTLIVGWLLVGAIVAFAHFRGRRRAR